MSLIGRVACLMALLALPVQAQDGPDASPQTQPQQQQQQEPQQQQQQDSQQPQPGQQSVEIETNLFCDTQQQVQRFVSLLDENGGSAEQAIAGVNAETKTPDACVIATIAFRRAGLAGEAKNGSASFDVMRIVVLGVYTLKGLEPALPMELFTLVPRTATDGTVGQGAR